MSEPLIKLQSGKALGAFDGVVETWNYVVDFVQNLAGDGELDENGSAKIDRRDDKRPVIRIDKSKVGGGGGGGTNIRIVGTDGTAAVVGDPTSTDYKSVSFASASDANVSVHVEGDGNGNATVTLGVYYK